MRHPAAFAFFFTMLSLGAAAAQESGDVAAGRQMARDYCARCHSVEPGGAFKEFPPSFQAIAIFRSEDQIYSRIWYPPLHSSMPTMADYMTPKNVRDLVAYIRSLEGS